jgi:hypothetical protein
VDRDDARPAKLFDASKEALGIVTFALLGRTSKGCSKSLRGTFGTLTMRPGESRVSNSEYGQHFKEQGRQDRIVQQARERCFRQQHGTWFEKWRISSE